MGYPSPVHNAVRGIVSVKFTGDDVDCSAVIDTAAGCKVKLTGDFYPSELDTVAQIVFALRSRRSRYRPDYKNREASSFEEEDAGARL